LLLVVDLGAETAAYRSIDLQRLGVINDVVAGVEIALVSDPGNDQRWSVFSRRLDVGAVELELVGDRLQDVETGTTWDPVRGLAINGSLAGEVLAILPGFTAFPADFDTFWPEGRLWQP
jgi:hypothetical protein